MKDQRNSTVFQKIVKIIKEKTPQSIEELIAFSKEELQIPEQEILEIILRMQSEGRISLKKQYTSPSSLVAYLRTEQSYWYWMTMFTATVTAIVVFMIPEGLYPWAYIRYVLGAIFVLWLPGYTFIKALFPAEPNGEKSKESLDYIERIALSLGMSLALVPIIGLLLNYSPWGIRLTPIVLSLLFLTLVFATVALMREYQKAKISK